MNQKYPSCYITKSIVDIDYSVTEFEAGSGYGTYVVVDGYEYIDYEYSYGKHRKYSKKRVGNDYIVQSSFTEDDMDFIQDVSDYFKVHIPILDNKEFG